MSRTIEVFTIKEVDYVDQYGFQRREKVKDRTMVLTMTDRTKEFKYYHEVHQMPIAVNAVGVEYVRPVQTDFGPGSQTWSRTDAKEWWYESYSGKMGSERLSPIDPKTVGVVG